MIKKKHFFDEYNEDYEIDEIAVIIKSSIKLLKFSGSSHYSMSSEENLFFIACSSMYLHTLLPLKDMQKIDYNNSFNNYIFANLSDLKKEFIGLTAITRIDCINIKQNTKKYLMYLVWENNPITSE